MIKRGASVNAPLKINCNISEIAPQPYSHRCSNTISVSLIRLHSWMSDALRLQTMTFDQNQRIYEAVSQERSRLSNFIRLRVPDARDAEDILQDVFYELVEANRLLMPIEQLTGWLYRLARNRIIDL